MLTSLPNNLRRPAAIRACRLLTAIGLPLLVAWLPACGSRTQLVDRDEELREPSWNAQVAKVRSGQSSSIHLSKLSVSDEQLRVLKDLDGLETLILDAGSITDVGFAWIAGCRSLEHVRVRNSPISDLGIEKLAAGNCVQLRILNLPQAKISAPGARHLSSLRNLKQLRIGGSQLDDSTVAELAKLPALESLHLIGPRLTDKALESIAAMPQLGSFYLDECKLNDAAWQKLFAAHPNLHVHIDQHHHDRDPNKHAD